MQTLGFWNKVMVSSANNYAFEKQLLYCYWVLVENECLNMGYRRFCMIYGRQVKWTAAALKSFSGTFLGQGQRIILPVSRMLSILFILLRRKNGQMQEYILIHGLWPWFGWTIRDLEHNWKIGLEKTQRSGEEVCGQSSLNGQKALSIFESQVNAHLRVTSVNQVNRMKCAVDTRFFTQPLLSLPMGL